VDGRSPSTTSDSFNGLLGGDSQHCRGADRRPRALHGVCRRTAPIRAARAGAYHDVSNDAEHEANHAKRLTWWRSQRGEAHIEDSSSVFVRIPFDHDVASDTGIRTAMTAGQRGLGVQEQRGPVGHRRSGPSPIQAGLDNLER